MEGGVIGTIIGWLGYHLGLRTDAASSTGSAHGKLGDIKSYLVNTIYAYLTGTVMASNLLAHGSAIKSIQRGTTNVGGGFSTTITISAVTMAKTHITMTGCGYYEVVSSTQITYYGSDYSTHASWEAIEYY